MDTRLQTETPTTCVGQHAWQLPRKQVDLSRSRLGFLAPRLCRLPIFQASRLDLSELSPPFASPSRSLFALQFLVQPNPVHNGSLIALFPLAQHARACIGLALSLDGVEWSEMTPLIRCGVHGERAEHQPIGLVLLDSTVGATANTSAQEDLPAASSTDAASSSPTVAIYLNERVPDIGYDESAPHRLFKMHQKLALQRGGSKVVRYLLPCSVLSRWTSERLAELSIMGSGTAPSHGGRRGATPNHASKLAWRMARQQWRYTCKPSTKCE